MTKENDTPNSNKTKNENAKKTAFTVKPIASKLWYFIKTKIGPMWFLFIVLLGIYCIFRGLPWMASLIFIFITGPITILIMRYARPDIIVSRNLWASKFGWDVLYPATALLFGYAIAWTFVVIAQEYIKVHYLQ